MSRTIKYVIWGAAAVALILTVTFLWPYIYVRLYTNSGMEWISEEFDKKLKDKNELVVYDIQITGQETISTKAALIGTANSVVIPYTFNVSYAVDLSKAKVTASENAVELRVPSPAIRFYKLDVDQERVKVDTVHILSLELYDKPTAEEYQAMYDTIEQRLYEVYANNEECLQDAWGNAVKNLTNLFKSVVELNGQSADCSINVIRDDTLTEATEAPPATARPE